MDETAYRDACGRINRLPCVFEKALLLGCATCAIALRHALAERETVACSEAASRADCLAFYRLLREKSLFALKLPAGHERLPHAAEMKLQCGGLRGLQEVLDGPADVHLLVHDVNIAELPYSQIIRGVAAWRGRRSRGGEQ